MVSEEAYAAVVAENAQQRERLALLEGALAQALERLGGMEAAPNGGPPAGGLPQDQRVAAAVRWAATPA